MRLTRSRGGRKIFRVNLAVDELVTNYVRDDKIFVVRIGEELIVKRTIENGEAGWMLMSDNPNKDLWPNRSWPDGASVVGKVCWTGRTLV